MKNIFRIIIKEEIEKELNNDMPKYVIYFDDELKKLILGETKFINYHDTEYWVNGISFEVNNYKTEIFKRTYNVPKDKVIPIDTNYYEVFGKYVDDVFNKALKVFDNSEEGVIKYVENGGAYITKNKYDGVDFYLVDNDGGIKNIHFCWFLKTTFDIMETDDMSLQFHKTYHGDDKVRIIRDRQDLNKILKMYEFLKRGLTTLYNKYKTD